MFRLEEEDLDGEFTIVTRTGKPQDEVAADREEQAATAEDNTEEVVEEPVEEAPPRRTEAQVKRAASRRVGRFKSKKAGTVTEAKASPKAVPKGRVRMRPGDSRVIDVEPEENTRLENGSGGKVSVESVMEQAREIGDKLADKVAGQIDPASTIEGNVWAVEFNEMLDALGIGDEEGVNLPRAVLLQIGVNMLCYMMPKLERAFHEKPSNSTVQAINTVIGRVSDLTKDLDGIWNDEEIENEAITNIIDPSKKALLNRSFEVFETLRDDISERVEAIVKDEGQKVKLLQDIESTTTSHFETLSSHIHAAHEFFLQQVRRSIIDRRKLRKRK